MEPPFLSMSFIDILPHCPEPQFIPLLLLYTRREIIARPRNKSPSLLLSRNHEFPRLRRLCGNGVRPFLFDGTNRNNEIVPHEGVVVVCVYLLERSSLKTTEIPRGMELDLWWGELSWKDK